MLQHFFSISEWSRTNGRLISGPCPKCHHFEYLLKVHYWEFTCVGLPLITVDMQHSLTCAQCNTVYIRKSLTSEMRMEIARSPLKSKYPWKTLAGIPILLLFLGLILGGLFWNQRRRCRAALAIHSSEAVFSISHEDFMALFPDMKTFHFSPDTRIAKGSAYHSHVFRIVQLRSDSMFDVEIPPLMFDQIPPDIATRTWTNAVITSTPQAKIADSSDSFELDVYY